MISYETKKNDLIEKIENGAPLVKSDFFAGRGRVIEFDDLPAETQEQFYKNYVGGDYDDADERRTATEIKYYSFFPLTHDE